MQEDWSQDIFQIRWDTETNPGKCEPFTGSHVQIMMQLDEQPDRSLQNRLNGTLKTNDRKNGRASLPWFAQDYRWVLHLANYLL